MSNFNVKRISDPVHGSIGLSDLEVKIISAPAFQRLRHIKQLGLAYYVFPGADYSRFSHSLGVCYVTGRIMEALRDGGQDLDDTEIQKYRLAALLHDIGHYPYSHAMEVAIENYYKRSLFTTSENIIGEQVDSAVQSEDVPPFYKHEALGKEILRSDEKIKNVLQEAGYDPKDIYSIFLREEPPRFANLISSDLDADRIDYLLRTAHHTGLPYGAVDLDYLLSQITVDSKGRICLSEKALRTADHFLLCRYFDYQQVAYHKTVAALELVLKDVLADLLEYSVLDCSGRGILTRIQDGSLSSFDDSQVLEYIRALQGHHDVTEIERTKAQSLLLRRPPKLIVEKETIQERTTESKQAFRAQIHSVKREIPIWSRDFGLDEKLWYVWDQSVTLTKIGSRVPVSTFNDETDSDSDGEESRTSQNRDMYQQEIRFLQKSKNTSRAIFDLPYSLMSVLSNYELHSLRIYVLLPADQEDQRDAIAQRIKKDLLFVGWKE